ncbi:radical SAM/SPASM domain-containing protein [Clostridium sp.]|uniref:radical SAM/SPASM domain-containing protein n=1 Tax=Clostridium sp. TaxID=1506 RepID=UPI00260EF7C1|nr:radical SAM/SPASM domain-containing protein [Clostridium sp.]
MIKYTELKEHKRHNLLDVIPLNKPYTLLIEPSNFCNFKCIQCFQSIESESYLSKNKGLMTIDLYTNVINQFKNWDGDKLKVLKLSLYGEPFTNTNFCDMLKIAKEANIAERIETTTNASLLTKEICGKLVEYEIDYIRVSIYSPKQQKHEKITNSSIDILDIYNNLKYIQKLKKEKGVEKPFVSAKMLDTFSTENEEFLNKYKEVADEVYIDKPHNWVAHEEKSFIGSLYNEVDKEKLEKDLEETISDRIACPMPFTTLAVRNNGDVSPCCVDWLGGTNLGNILEENIKDIWNGEKMYQFRKMQLENRRFENTSCRNCELVLNDYYTRDNIDGFPVEKLR